MRVNSLWGSVLSALAVGACDPIEVGRLDDPPREHLSGDAQADLLDAGELTDGAFEGEAGVGDSGLKPSMTVERDASRSDAARPDAAASADAGSDAGATPTDAGSTTPPPTDAGSDAGSDAGHDAGTTAPCDGRRLFGLCWYLGAAGASCNTECAPHGGYDTRATSYIGTESQGGSYEECDAILDLLGRSSRLGEGKRDDDYGLGCHVWTDGDLWWLNTPQFRPSVSASGVRIVCGCIR